MTLSADVAKAMDVVTSHLSWGDAEVLAALEHAPFPSSSGGSHDCAPPSRPLADDTPCLASPEEMTYLRVRWEAWLSPQSASTRSTETRSLCTSTCQCLIDAMTADADADIAATGAFTSVVDAVLPPLLTSLSTSTAKAPPTGQLVTLNATEKEMYAAYATIVTTVLPHFASATASQQDDGAASACPVRVSQLLSSHTVPALNRLLEPFTRATVDPLAKSLSFHFAPGQKTARLDAPQYFFSYLTTQLTELSDTVSASWRLGDDAVRVDTSLLLLVAQGCFLCTARAVFVDGYKWTATSPFLEQVDYTVAVVNAIVDFAATADSVADVAILSECFITPLLLSPALNAHFHMAARSAERALEQGPSVLWRRRFLRPTTTHTAPMEVDNRLRCSSLHFLRAVDAYVSRMVRDLAPVTSPLANLPAQIWQCVVTPDMLIFTRFMRSHLARAAEDEACQNVIARLEYSFTVLGCCATVLAVADQWLSVLQPQNVSVTSGALDTVAVDELTLLTETVRRDSIRLVRDLARDMAATTDGEMEGEARALAFRRMDGALRFMDKVADDCTRTLVRDALRDSLHEHTLAATRPQLHDHCQHRGYHRIAELLL